MSRDLFSSRWDFTVLRIGKWRLRLLWLPPVARFGPWPLWSWGVRIGHSFDVGYLRVAVIKPREPRI